MSLADDFIDVFYGNNEFTNFGAQLLRLIQKADSGNRYNLAKGYPKEVAVYEHWMHQKEMPSPETVRTWCEYYETTIPGQAFR